MQRRSRKGLFILITISIIATAAEIIAYACCLLMGDGYFAPKPTRDEFVTNLQEQFQAENFDANLGWIPLKRDRETNGVRISPDNPASGRPCLSLYGDSFVFGNEVRHAAAWANQLAKRLNCKVSNFGVGGYGTDQAYLRFAENLSDPSSVVMLGILSENIVRNVNQNRAFLYGNAGVGPLKPMFWLGDTGQLQLVPVPKLTMDSYDQYMKNPRALFAKEFFIPDSSFYAEQRVYFPYIISLINALRYKRIYYGLLFYVTKGLPWYRDFYDPLHPSHAIQVTASIADHFVEHVKERAKTPIIIFLPTSRDVGSFLRSGKWVYGALYEWCQARGYNCFDAGTAMVEKLGAKHINEVGLCKYFCTNRFTEQGHYNEKGNALLADVSLRYLKDYLPEAKVADGVTP
jgi:hypothetical protein